MTETETGPMPPISDPNHPDHSKWQQEHAGGNAGEQAEKPRKKASPAKAAAAKKKSGK